MGRREAVIDVSTLMFAFSVGGTVTGPEAAVALASRPAAASETERIRFPFFSIFSPSIGTPAYATDTIRPALIFM